MKNTETKNLSSNLWTVCDETAFLAYKVHSAVELLRLIVSLADEDNLLNQEPLTGLPGVLALFESVDDDTEKLEKLTADIIKPHNDKN